MLRRDDRGAQAVEFAILVPVLLIIVTGIVYFGLVFWSQSTIQQAAREGARYVAICNTNAACVAGTATKVKANTPGLLSDSKVKILVVQDCTQSGSTASIVKVTYPWNILGFTNTITAKASTPCGG
jgi:Flp pilus assembly protein TadG